MCRAAHPDPALPAPTPPPARAPWDRGVKGGAGGEGGELARGLQAGCEAQACRMFSASPRRTSPRVTDLGGSVTDSAKELLDASAGRW